LVISGGTGLIGTALMESLVSDGHEVTLLVRSGSNGSKSSSGSTAATRVEWSPETGEIDLEAIEGSTVFVNLSGSSIGDHRWNAKIKDQLLTSRLAATELMVKAATTLALQDGVLINASAVGFYGSRGDEVLTEESVAGKDFLGGLCRRWESAADTAATAGVRVVKLRTGIVLSSKGGALAKQLPLFRFGLGAKLGSGKQWTSWISIHDEVGAIRHAISNDDVAGPLNLVAPEPVTNGEFTRSLARALHRPAIFSAPAPVLRAAFGSEMAEEILLCSQRAVPQKLSDTGYQFRFPRLESALDAVLSRSTAGAG
jgi:uncharacterized protein (TIGR01777 family)